MTRKHIQQLLANGQLDSYEREHLNQLLHYMRAEGVDTTSERTTHNGYTTKSTRTKNSHKPFKSNARTQQHNKR